MKLVRALALAAALCYSAWIFGYIFNYGVALVGPASDLAVKDQPYSYLFLWSDIVASSLVLLLGAYLYDLNNFLKTNSITILYMLFGVLTAAAALNPLTCIAGQSGCIDTGYSTHIFLGALASICLLIASVLELARRSKHTILLVLAVCVWAVLGMYDIVFQSQGPSVVTAISQRALLGLVAWFIYYIPVNVARSRK